MSYFTNKLGDFWPPLMTKKQYENAIKHKDLLIKKFGKHKYNEAIKFYEMVNKIKKTKSA